MKVQVFCAAYVLRRDDGWWIELIVDGLRVPGQDAGPFASEAEAQAALADFRAMLASLSVPTARGEA